MTRTLLLLRHAKSSWEDPSLADFDRPLNDRGRRAAPAMGAWLRNEGLVPELVLCSAAQRAMDTWALLAPETGVAAAVRVEHDLYHAEPERILQFVRSAGDDVRTLMLIGHNPGLESFADAIVGDGKKKELARMRSKFPTAAVAVIEFDVDRWSGVAPGSGTLRRFVRPKEL